MAAMTSAVIGSWGPAATAGTGSGRARSAVSSATGELGAPVAREVAPGKAVKVAAFNTEPVVLTGADFPDWTSGPEITARPPQAPTDYEVYNTQGTVLSPVGLQSDCYQSNPKPDVNGQVDANNGDHNCFQGSDSPVRTVLKGVPPQSLLGYRFDASSGKFVQIPFQVDTKWQHYISNNASGFAFYSGADQMLTYTYDTEPFLYTSNPKFDPSNPTDVCQARPPAGQSDTTPDPNKYLINTDELSFMAHDGGSLAPPSAALPAGIVSANQVRLVDPNSGITRYAYIMESSITNGQPTVAPAYTAANSPYVHYNAFDPFTNSYKRFDGANRHGVESTPPQDMFAYSQSNYSNYGNAPVGPVCNLVKAPDGTVSLQPVIGQGFKQNSTGGLELDQPSYVQRRTLDIATVTTPRYKFQYGNATPDSALAPNALLAGRMIMDGLQVSSDNGGLTKHDYGRKSIIDRFKGRAFQQAPGGRTPCCGYEDEQVNWNGSSITMGIKVGPVRVIRTTWGSDSGTNVTRSDIFYADSVDHEYNLRVHPIPPLDGIYTQWNMDAGAVGTYYNPYNTKGVPITGINPVLYGDTTDFVGPGGVSESSNDKLGREQQSLNGGKPLSVGNPSPSSGCSSPAPASITALPAVPSNACTYGSFNLPDATFSGPSPLLSWEELTGSGGTMVEKWFIDPNANPSPGGAQSAVEAAPYYVDDSCFDDGTGNSPGPQVNPRGIDPTTWGFESVAGKAVAVSPAPPANERYLGTVTDGGQTYNTTSTTPPDTFGRRCWNHNADGTPYNIPGTATYNANKPAQKQDPAPDKSFGPLGDVRYFEGDIATHGVHLLFTSDTDNADLTTAVDEIDVTDHQVILAPDQKNVGAAFAQQYVTPIVSVVTPFGVSSLAVPQPYVAGSGMPSTPVSGTAGTGSSNPGASDSLVPAGSVPAGSVPSGATTPAGAAAPASPLVGSPTGLLGTSAQGASTAGAQTPRTWRGAG
ncbi:MAG: hypothetical protein ACYDB3_06405 [Acidimicrobiales bacterium]